MKNQKVYEITDTSYDKYYILGLRNDEEATAFGKRVMKGNFFGISYYDDYPSERTDWKKNALTKSEFIKQWSWRYK